MKSFADTLLELGIITREQLEKAIAHQWEQGGKLEESLIKLGYFTEESLLRVLERKFDFYPVNLTQIEIAPEVLKLVPAWLAKRFLIVPIAQSDTSLACVMVNPLDREALAELKKAVYHDILPFIARKSEIEKFIAEHYREEVTEKEEDGIVAIIPGAQEVPALLKKYTFENFITGKCNDFAYSVALGVARGYSEETNPLFIYSDVGMGKTHLLIAIWNYILEHKQRRKVFFSSSERFISALKEAIEAHKLKEFRDQYNKIDVLLIDDIGLIEGEEVAQQQFFHIFNDLFQNSKQIVVTSDRPPKELPTLSARLKSRFEGGVISKIDPPDLETRTAILKAKARDLKISDELISLIAHKVQSNVRELEGVLKEVVAYVKYKKEPLTKDVVEEILMQRSTLKPYV